MVKNSLEIDKKYLNVLGIPIYNTGIKQHGILSDLSIKNVIGGYILKYTAFFSVMYPDMTVFKEDFANGDVKFVLIDSDHGDDWYKNHCIESIKAFMDDEFSEDVVMRISEDERSAQIRDQETNEIFSVNKCLNKFDFMDSQVIHGNYYLLRLYRWYKDGIISENQMLYGFVNAMFSENMLYKTHYEPKKSS